jgi:hypothetical protein
MVLTSSTECAVATKDFERAIDRQWFDRVSVGHNRIGKRANDYQTENRSFHFELLVSREHRNQGRNGQPQQSLDEKEHQAPKA